MPRDLSANSAYRCRKGIGELLMPLVFLGGRPSEAQQAMRAHLEAYVDHAIEWLKDAGILPYSYRPAEPCEQMAAQNKFLANSIKTRIPV
jgi:hypothetical protein